MAIHTIMICMTILLTTHMILNYFQRKHSQRKRIRHLEIELDGYRKKAKDVLEAEEGKYKDCP